MALLPRTAAILIGVLLLAARAAPQAAADEAGRIAEATTLCGQIESARRAVDKDALGSLLPKVAALHNALEDEASRKRLQTAVGDVLDGDDLAVSTRSAAADVLAELHDERVWNQLKREWPALDVEAATPVQVRVVVAAGKIAAPASATELIDMLRRARDPNLVETSLTALAGFGWARNRVSVLGALGDSIPLVEGGGAGGARGGKVSPEAASLWRRLGPTLLATLNALTGRSEPTLEAWTVLLKDYRRRLEALFLRERS